MICRHMRSHPWLLVSVALLACGTDPEDDRQREPALITLPAENDTFRGGDEISFRGIGFDLEGTPLDASRFTWWAELHHDDHTHPFLTETSGIDSGSVTIPRQGETSDNIFYRFYMAVDYPDGGVDTVIRDIQPEKIGFALASIPGGLQLTLDGQPQLSPISVIGVVGMERQVGVVSPQTLGDSTYTFVGWSQGGPANQTIVTLDLATTYFATFTASPAGNQPPSITITSPANGVTLGQGSPIMLTATAADADGSVVQVEFFDGGTSVGIDATSPYQVAWTPATLGSHPLTARATDDSGTTTTSSIVGVTITPGGGPDTEAPALAIATPANGAQGIQGAVSITANASDNVGVVGVRFQVDGVDLGVEDLVSPFAVTLPSTVVYASGQHVIRAQARDASGNRSPWVVSTVEFGGNVDLPSGFMRTLYVPSLPSLATTMAFAPDGRLFICLQDGDLRVFKNGVLLAQPFVTVPTTANGERGLLGVAFHPNFASNGWVYVYYTSSEGGQHNRISRFTAAGDTAETLETVLVDLPNLSGATNHNGGALHFGADGMLYAAVGDNANGSNAQSMSTVFGKMLRFNDDGSIPSDNPFFNSAAGLNRSIWALGLRNPYTFGVQPGTGRIFINDVGQGTWEEINEGVEAGNYGWPTTEGPTSNPNFQGPVYAYEHNNGFVQGVAIVGSAFYNPPVATFPASYIGSYFFADYVGGWIHRLDPGADNTVSIFARIPHVQTDLRLGPDGALYSLAEVGGNWAVYRVSFGP
jgi:glucose/arabinose dehydrogenase